MFAMKKLNQLREKIDSINLELLRLLNERAKTVLEIYKIRKKTEIDLFNPKREAEMLDLLEKNNTGPYSNETVRELFRNIFKASLDLMEKQTARYLLCSRNTKPENTIVRVRDVSFGEKEPVIIAGPCSIESLDQLDKIARGLKKLGIKVMRGGAFKPRTSPYTFQGLGIEGIHYLKNIAEKYNLVTISEIVDPRHIDVFCELVDILQIGTRNMANFELLKSVGKTKKPVLLKRGFMSTMEEYLHAVDYIISNGNPNVILCERGIRTFEKWTRNTLDISAVSILKQVSHLPLIVDISHSAGRKDIAVPLGKASLAAGADGIMVEVHHDPQLARSDEHQQLNLDEFSHFMEIINQFIGFLPTTS